MHQKTGNIGQRNFITFALYTYLFDIPYTICEKMEIDKSRVNFLNKIKIMKCRRSVLTGVAQQ